MRISRLRRHWARRRSLASSAVRSNGCSPFPDRLSVTISGANRLLDVPRETLAADLLAGRRGPDRAAVGIAALAGGQGAPGNFRGTPGRRCQAPAGSNPMGQSRVGWRLGRQRASGNHRRRHKIGRCRCRCSGGLAKKARGGPVAEKPRSTRKGPLAQLDCKNPLLIRRGDGLRKNRHAGNTPFRQCTNAGPR